MKKHIERMIPLALAGIFLLSLLVSCVSLEKMGIKKGKQPASQATQGDETQTQASLPQKGATVTQPAQSAQGTTQPTTQQEAGNYFVHQVKWPNESLSIIAKWYTGSLMNWKVLARANPEMKPTVIHKGDRIRIPANMLKTRDPMPESFVEELVQNLKKQKPPEAPEGEPTEEEPALFGPKGLESE